MIRKRILALVGLLALLALVLVFFERESELPDNYVFEANSGISLKDVEKAREPVIFDNSDQGFFIEEKSFSSGGIEVEDRPSTPRIAGFTAKIDYNTLKFFRYLHRLYAKSGSLDEHLSFVSTRLKQQLPPEQAEKILKIYQDYLQCEIDLAAESAQWTYPDSFQEVLDLLTKLHEYRRKILGVELADALFGAEVKSKEYSVRRSNILADEDLYGAEKEQLLEKLNHDMWGDEASQVEQKPKPYNRYREKLQIYSKDFGELSAEERSEKMNEFRESFFSKDVVQRLEAVDTQIATEKAAEEQYFQDQAEIMNNAELTEEEKEDAVFALQNETFGDQAESFRRREAIRKGLEALKAQTESAQK
ncbi:MAG: lipase chaperone [Proteobacteria bacterium]|nr:lipase chaperone [Pseudomonadota bacterium]